MKRLLYIVTIALCLLAACANPGSGPDGGPYDETPPRIVAMSPAIGQTNVGTRKVTLSFNEFIKLENPSEKITISPPQIAMPSIKTSGKRITVELHDSLKPDATYTIDFSDAIEDNNEGNPMGNFTYFFSTGSELDTLEVSGHVLAAADLEPVKGILVGLHSDTTDSAFRTKPFERVARTDSRGHFSIKGVAQGTYRIFALKDMDGDFRFSQKGEMVAFGKERVVPSAVLDIRHDTLWTDTVRYDTVLARPFTHFLPDDLTLLAFTESDQPRHLLKTQRDVPEWFKIYFTAPSDSLPRLRGLDFDARKALLASASKGNDTLTCWLLDTALMARDTLSLICTFEATDDSTGLLTMQTDTLLLRPKLTMEKRKKREAENLEKWEKQRERRHKRGDFSQETPPVEYMTVNFKRPRPMAPDNNPVLEFSEPLAAIDSAGVHLLLEKDSTQIEAPYLLEPVPYNPLAYTLFSEWRPGQKYEVLIDSAAVTGIYGHVCRKLSQPLTIGAAEDFGTIFVTLHDADTTAIVQLMKEDGKPLRQVRAPQGRADFYYLQPGTYYLRLFYDRNGNGTWDAGNYDQQLQAEEVHYFPYSIPVRANWDIEQAWDVGQTPFISQKPHVLVKQKEDAKKTVRNRNAERERNKR